MARDVDNIINSSSNPVVAFMIPTSAVTSELPIVSEQISSSQTDTNIVAFVNIQVGVHVPLVGSPHSPSHARPWLLECQYTFNIISMDLFSRNRIDDGRFDAKER